MSASRPLLPKRETKNTESSWARKVKARDGHLCRLEVKDGRSWRECGVHGTDAAHIYRRHECSKAKFDVHVGLCACRRHHEMLDRYEPDVRVPIKRLRAAYDAIVTVAKVPPPGGRP